jgi:hypothetical protein
MIAEMKEDKWEIEDQRRHCFVQGKDSGWFFEFDV